MRKRTKERAVLAVGIFVVAIIAGAIGWGVSHWHSESIVYAPAVATTPTSNSPNANQVAVPAPLYVSVMGPAGPVSSATVTIYTKTSSGYTQVWTGTTDTNGVATTDPMVFESGQSVLILVKGPDGGYTTTTYTVPYYTSSEAQIVKYHIVHVNYVPEGSFSLALMVSGAQYRSGNVTLSANNTNNVNIQVINTKAGSGAASIIDPKNGHTLGDYLVISSDQPIAIGGNNVIKITFGQTTYYVIPLSASSLFKSENGLTGGYVTAPITISKATASSPATLTVTLVIYGDFTQFKETGTWGDYAVTTSASFNLIFS